MHTRRVGILLFPDVELLDYCGPFEVFSVTRLRPDRRREEPSPFEVLLVAEKSGTITTIGGMRVLPDCTCAACPPLDILLVPGGWGTREQMRNAFLIDWIRNRARQAETLASVCTGALLLGSAGLLDGLQATTHWQALDLMQQTFPRVELDRTRHFIQHGRVFTSAGISAGIDMALKLVEHHFGEGVARSTAKYMEYPYPDDDKRRIEI
ncbi:MAG TPA: DJ-1/PfpI family protein [Rhodanobacteraceae bacterium]|nr:DJ-1/PfpI family protein [Rhodanobacteraceae bacterium]